MARMVVSVNISYVRVLECRTRVCFFQLDTSDMLKKHIKTNIQLTNPENISLLFSADCFSRTTYSTFFVTDVKNHAREAILSARH